MKRAKHTTNDDLIKKLEKKHSGFKKGVEEELENLKIAYILSHLREKRHMTQGELAKRIGTSQSNVARMERADYKDYRVSTLQRIAHAYGLLLDIRFTSAKGSNFAAA